MNYYSIFAVSFTIALSGALTPGPLLATVIHHSGKHGFKTGPLVILGHAILEIIMVTLLVLGFGNMVNNPEILKGISITGGIILAFFGGHMLKDAKIMAKDTGKAEPHSTNLVITGFIISVSNPHWTIWWLTVGLGLVLAANKNGPAALAVFFAGHILADLAWYSIISFAIAKGKKFISESTYSVVIAVCGITLICFGLYIALFAG